MYFPTKESAYFTLGGDWGMMILYGYQPGIAHVPLPPAALLMLGALFAAARPPNGPAGAEGRREPTDQSAIRV